MTGRECPICHRVWAPYVAECPGPHTTFDVRTSHSTREEGTP